MRQVCWIVFVLLLLLASSCGEIPNPQPVGQTPATPVEDYPWPPTSAPKPARTPSPTDPPKPPTVAPTPTPTTVPPTPLPPYVPEEGLPANLPTIVYAVRRPEQAAQVWTLRYEKGVLQEKLLVDLSPAVLENRIDRGYRFIGQYWVDKLSVSPDGRYVEISLIELEGYMATSLIIDPNESKDLLLVGTPLGKILDWIPDSDRVVLAKQDGIMWGTASLDSTDYINFPIPDILDAVALPGGKQIIFSTIASHNVWMGTIDVNGQNLSPFPLPDPLPGDRVQNLALSPDKQTCAYTWDRRGTYYGGGQIWVMDIDGANQRPLGPNNTYDFDLDWSPDNRHIVFVRSKDPSLHTRPSGLSSMISSLWLIDAQGGKERLLLPSEGQYAHWSPRWLPGDTGIAFLSNQSGEVNIWFIRPDGTGLQQLTYQGELAGEIALLYGEKGEGK